MEAFSIIPPAAALTPFVKHYWFLKADSYDDSIQRIIPTGSISIMFHRGCRLYSLSDNTFQPDAFLSGQSGRYTELLHKGQADMICIVFQPHGAGLFFRLPMHELYDSNISISDLEDSELEELQQRLFESSGNLRCAELIDNFLIGRLDNAKLYNHRRLNAVFRAINSGQGGIAKLAGISCLGYKQFKRVFTDYTGSNPKEFLRVVRFQRALFALQTQPGISLTQLAFDCGYYDQPHLIKEFRVFSGYTPSQYLAICLPYSDYFSS